MAQQSDSENSIDNTDIINPSAQRVRNILTLKERVAVIEAYDQRPVYTKVARMFNCSWEQIKNIVANRDAIMEFYNATLNEKLEVIEKKDNIETDLKERKIKFLGECVYESIKRLQYHAKQPVTEELIRLKALEFQDILKIDNFMLNKKWLNIFKANYNISLSNRQIAIHTPPPSSLDLKDIMTYCTKQKANKINNNLQSRYNSFDKNSEEYENKRLRKLNFLREALSEYMLRVKVHHKSIKLTSMMMMRKITTEFNQILKVEDFEPTLGWIKNFMKHFDSQLNITNIKKPPLSLDLKDILSYCSRMHNKTKAPTVTLAPKETSLQMRIIPKFPGNTISDSGLKFQQNSIIYLDEECENDTKSDLEDIQVQQSRLEQPPPLKIRKIESINNDPELQRNFTIPQQPLKSSVTDEHKSRPHKELQKTCIFVAEAAKENMVHKNPAEVNVPDVQIKDEIVQENDFMLSTTSALKTRTSPIPTTITIAKPENYSTPTTTLTDDNENDVELPRHVTGFKDILLLLKPLEEYAMLKENYRAIGLITQLEEVFKIQTQEENSIEEDEEFIG